MANMFQALKWRICGSYDPEGPVTEDGPIRALNRAKYETWKYNTFGPGRDVFCRDRDFVYKIIDSGELQGEPLHVNDPHEIAGLASIIAEMEGHKFIALMTPRGTHMTKEDVEKQEDEAIGRWVKYRIRVNYGTDPQSIRRSLQDKILYDKICDNEVSDSLEMAVIGSEEDPTQAVDSYQEDQKRHFKEMLETLKHRHKK